MMFPFDRAKDYPLKNFWQKHVDPETAYLLDDFARGLPVLGAWLRANDNREYYADYLRNRGMSWNDIKYHKASLGYGGASVSTMNFVSKNIDKLYR